MQVVLTKIALKLNRPSKADNNTKRSADETEREWNRIKQANADDPELNQKIFAGCA